MTAVIIVAALPVFSLPALLSAAPDAPADIVRTLLYGYPIYVLTASWLAYASYSERPYISWILVALTILSHIAMWALVTSPSLD